MENVTHNSVLKIIEDQMEGKKTSGIEMLLDLSEKQNAMDLLTTHQRDKLKQTASEVEISPNSSS